MIPRTLTKTIKRHSKDGFVDLIYGPRRVGKTVLLKQLTDNTSEDSIAWFNGDTQETRDALQETSETKLRRLVKGKTTIVVDEAQRIKNIGLTLKILVDMFPEKDFLVTGSSSLLLSKGIQEPLTGRNNTYRLYPLSTRELTGELSDYKKSGLLEEQLIYGGYPYLTDLSSGSEKQAYLKSIANDYLFRDLLLIQDISYPDTMRKLTTLLAFQIGSEVSYNELANNLDIDVKTVMRYLSLLKNGFIIFELGSFSRNLRKEVAKSKKYYFWDLGIRNALIDQFLPLDSRTDKGALWENFLAIERIKKHEYARNQPAYFFWRTYDQAEIDWIEIRGEKIDAWEFKFADQRVHTPKAFKQTYNEEVDLVSRENYVEFVT